MSQLPLNADLSHYFEKAQNYINTGIPFSIVCDHLKEKLSQEMFPNVVRKGEAAIRLNLDIFDRIQHIHIELVQYLQEKENGESNKELMGIK